ncbi:hypothetical protein E3N88_16587 [Mikania micrantha]|uniref:Uncharacterized protein n=1 Tax=Mikania micrantha TaxID=192012 RepID=A0A5N6P025_9ASTR|nr:hypothetical protein E3N88_16587 [Mikania micrantha]
MIVCNGRAAESAGTTWPAAPGGNTAAPPQRRRDFRAHMLKILLVRRRRRPESCQSCWRRMAKQTPPMESSRQEEKDAVEIGG